MAKELTIKGRFFKEIAQKIVAEYGFGSNKMVKRNELETWQEIGNMPREYYDFMEMGYLRIYETGYYAKSRAAYKYGVKEWTIKDKWIGLTAKGWSVADKYLNA